MKQVKIFSIIFYLFKPFGERGSSISKLCEHAFVVEAFKMQHDRQTSNRSKHLISKWLRMLREHKSGPNLSVD